MEQEVFLGRELSSRRQVSERTAQRVDDEVSRVINQAYTHAVEVLTKNRVLLDTVAAALLERETLTRDDFVVLMRGDKLLPRPLPPASPTPAATPAPATESWRTNLPLLGGAGAESSLMAGAAMMKRRRNRTARFSAAFIVVVRGAEQKNVAGDFAEMRGCIRPPVTFTSVRLARSSLELRAA